MKLNSLSYGILLACILVLQPVFGIAQKKQVTINWDKIITVSKTTPTLQVVVNPMLRRNSPICHDAFNALKNFGADYVRFVPWYHYPHMAVVELKPPAGNKTFWNFSHIDPIVEDFMEATKGHSVVMNFSTIPAWMFVTDQKTEYPEDSNLVCRTYNQGMELRDTTLKELTDYDVRLLSWYTKGGFTDEVGVYHKSGYFYNIPYWEILNEPDIEHRIGVQEYTHLYDAIVIALKKIIPGTKLVGMSLANESDPDWFEYFLDSSHHIQGVLPEILSYHFYGKPDFKEQAIEAYQYSFYNKADAFLDRVRYIENIRKRLAPHSLTFINEIGNIIGDQEGTSIPEDYWNLSGGMFAYIYIELAKMGIDVAGESQLVGFPTEFPSVTMIDWKNGQPNARFLILKLLKDNFAPGDKMVGTVSNSKDIAAQAFICGKDKKLLLINKRNKEIQIELPLEAKGAKIYSVGISTGNRIAESRLWDSEITLRPFEVSVIQLENY
jgi:hypothetical protein